MDLKNDKIELNGFTTVVDATKKTDMYMSSFGEVYENQVEHANSIILSHSSRCLRMISISASHYSVSITRSIYCYDRLEEIDGSKILEIMEQKKTLSAELDRLREGRIEDFRLNAEAEHHHHDHEHHHHDDEE